MKSWFGLVALLFLPIDSSAGFVDRAIEMDGESYSYTVFVPTEWTADKQWPVVLFLHGAGERGSDGTGQLKIGLPARIRELGDFPAVVVMPQCRDRMWWGDPAMEAQTFEALERSVKEFNGDPERVYLTGLSLGGYGVWAFGYKYPDRFAALAPVCGGVLPNRRIAPPDWHPASIAPDDPYTETARRVSAPVWVFHGDADRRVPVNESRKLAAALEAAGKSVRYTEYAGVGHDSWDRAYWEEELVPWLLSHRRGE
ncbi:MAG TPA: prolyl oligopeptidase family serine peptidase [Vicinamibacteria bacterium]|nr:prolyl oligopeptidase family serine peptidase [Vicinamibacteria bacterium]